MIHQGIDPSISESPTNGPSFERSTGRAYECMGGRIPLSIIHPVNQRTMCQPEAHLLYPPLTLSTNESPDEPFDERPRSRIHHDTPRTSHPVNESSANGPFGDWRTGRACGCAKWMGQTGYYSAGKSTRVRANRLPVYWRPRWAYQWMSRRTTQSTRDHTVT